MIDQNKILSFIKNNPNCSFLQISKGLKINYAKNQEVTKILFSLCDQNQIAKTGRDFTFYTAIEKIDEQEGSIHFASDAKFGFVDIEDENEASGKKSFFVPSSNFNNALDGDTVKISVYKYLDPDNLKTFSIVDQVIKRNTEKLIGILEQKNDFLTFSPISKSFQSLKFKINKIASEARINDVVQAKIVSYKTPFLAVDIIKKISNLNDPMVFVKALLVDRNAPEDFPIEVKEKSLLIPSEVNESDLKNRLDLRNELIVTIDGSDTKDFDDAISVVKNQNGTFTLGVHIADVEHYVKENDEIDQEALKRGTSTYLVDRVIPMLPEKLSNGICSLNPNVDRLTISVLINIDSNGKTISGFLKPTVINSKYRLTYERVDEFKNGNNFEDEKLNKMIQAAYELASVVRKYKINEGYIDFGITEPLIELDQEGNVVNIAVEKPSSSRDLIEDFMVRANEEVAKTLTSKKIPLLYRVHEKPGEEKIDYFLKVLSELNIRVNVNKSNITPKSFQETVENIKKQRNDEFLKMLFLRTMQKAAYSPNNIEHFGLASKEYCHFTSPIRRYPDLVVQRIIKDVIFDSKTNRINHYESILENIADKNSESEQLALQLERDTNDLKYAEFYNNKIGQELKGQIVSVLKFGLFVEFANKTEALVHISTLNNGPFNLNDAMTELSNGKTKYKLGDFVDVVIVGADRASGKIDAVLKKDYPSYLENLKNQINKNHYKTGRNEKIRK